MNKKPIIPSLIFSLFLIKEVHAHCPLCTIGAAAAAGGAAYLGVNNLVIGLFIGAFAVSIGWWFSNLIKKKFIPFQRTAIILLSFLTTILPMLPLMEGIKPLYINITGDYGSLLNRTYIFNTFLVGSIIGGIIVTLTPWLSSKLTTLRKGKMLPYQGTLLTLTLLITIGIIIQLTIWNK